MFLLLLNAVFFINMQKGAFTNNCSKLRQGMAQLESICALSSNIEKRIRRNAYLSVTFAIGAHLNMYYIYQVRYMTNVDDANRNIFEEYTHFPLLRIHVLTRLGTLKLHSAS